MLFCNFSVMIGHGRCFSQIFRKPCYCFPRRNASISPIKYSEPNATVFSVDDFEKSGSTSARFRYASAGIPFARMQSASASPCNALSLSTVTVLKSSASGRSSRIISP